MTELANKGIVSFLFIVLMFLSIPLYATLMWITIAIHQFFERTLFTFIVLLLWLIACGAISLVLAMQAGNELVKNELVKEAEK